MIVTPLFFALLGSFAIFSLFDLDDHEDADRPDRPDDQGDTTLIRDGTDTTGDDGPQTYEFDPEERGFVTARIDAGGGDDRIDLTRDDDSAIAVSSFVDGGDGNDTISIHGETSTVFGGPGDDNIEAKLLGSEIQAGPGDDLIRIVSGPSDPTVVDGGAGNDTINSTGSDNVVLRGGAGEDEIITDGGTFEGTGYIISADGGDGNDTLSHGIDVFPLPTQEPATVAARLSGGAGEDAFDLEFHAHPGDFTPADDDPEVFVNNAVEILDFEQGTDSLAIDLSEPLSGYDMVTATLSEDPSAEETTLTFRLSGDTLPDQDVLITIAATGLTWDDVTFVGPAPDSLSYAAA